MRANFFVPHERKSTLSEIESALSLRWAVNRVLLQRLTNARMTQIQSRVRRYLTKLHLLPLAFVSWRTLRELKPDIFLENVRLRRTPRKIPIPPGSLIFSATGTRNVRWFLESGKETASAFRNALAAIGRPIESFGAVLDLGCGCGRVLRQWENAGGPKFHGTDYNPAGIEWAKDNLKFVSFRRNNLSPPLNVPAGWVDLVYAVSVFTHLPAELQRPWIEELHRILEPGGILLLTLSGEGDLVRITSSERERFAAGELVVVDAMFAGTNMCGVYHPRAFVERNWSDLFEIKAYYPRGARGVPNQDLYVFQKR